MEKATFQQAFRHFREEHSSPTQAAKAFHHACPINVHPSGSTKLKQQAQPTKWEKTSTRALQTSRDVWISKKKTHRLFTFHNDLDQPGVGEPQHLVCQYFGFIVCQGCIATGPTQSIVIQIFQLRYDHSQAAAIFELGYMQATAILNHL